MAYTIAMSEDIIANLILALQQHPALTLIFVFIVALSESLIVIGLLVPGAILMILFGALITMEALEFWPTALVASCGAITGDSLSYWLGRRYQNKLHDIWPLSRHPEVILRANSFFSRHGVKSIVFSRFIGLLRPVIPAIAGMTRMPIKIFLTTNIISAIFWAPLYLLPGMLFGLSIEMASEFASKFVLLIIFLLLIIFVSLWAIQKLFIFIKPYGDKAIIYLLNWGKRHPLAGEVPAAIFDKLHPELRGLSLAALIIFCSTGLVSLLHSGLTHSYGTFYFNFDSLNQLIYRGLQSFRSPPFDVIMLWLSYLISSEFIALLCFSLGSLFILKKDFLSLWHWLAAISLPLLMSPLLSNNLTSTLQQNLNINIDSLPFIVIVCTIGFLTIIVNSGLSFGRQKLIYYISASFVLFLMLAQLYYATQVFSQALVGLFIGSVWFNLLGIAYQRHLKNHSDNKTRKEILLILTILLIYPTWQTIEKKEIHLSDETYYVMGTNSWIESGWTLLPIYRQGIYQNRDTIFNLQWLGTKEHIQSQLSRLGYTNSLKTTRSLSNWFLDDINVKKLPVLPHIHNGEYEAIRFHRYNEDETELTVVRLWLSKYKLKQNNPLQPLWYGSITNMELKKRPGITYLVTKKENIKGVNLDDGKLTIHEKNIFNIKENKKSTIFLLQ